MAEPLTSEQFRALVPGTAVVCLDAKLAHRLTVGATYIVADKIHGFDNLGRVRVEGNARWYYPTRFTLRDAPPDYLSTLREVLNP